MISVTVGTRASRRALLIAFGLVYFPQFCGIFIVLSYTTAFFAEAGSSLSPLSSSILIGVVQLIAGGLSTVLIEKTGRKLLLLTSCIGCGVTMLFLGVIFLSSTCCFFFII